jgi:nucleotide-binding universal stress UspA family protein
MTSFRGRVEAAMDEVLTPLAEEFSDVEMSRYAVAERAADAMEDASKGAQLTIVGRHSRAQRHGGFHVGSTARAVLHHTGVPVLVMPTIAHPADRQSGAGAPTFAPTY